MSPDPDPTRLIAARLADIAATVSGEAQALTHSFRAVSDRARDIAALAGVLDEAAQLIEGNVRQQEALLAAAKRGVADNEPVMAALAGSAETIAEMSRLVGEIADQSRLLSLNARIEAARAGDTGGGFASVATAMTDLSRQTHDATEAIRQRAQSIGGDVAAARTLIAGGVQFLDAENAMVGLIAGSTDRQRATAAQVATLTVEAVTEIEDATAAVGRVASAASVVGLLARQLTRAAAVVVVEAKVA